MGYRLLMTALVPLRMLHLAWRGRREPGYRLAWGERFHGLAGAAASEWRGRAAGTAPSAAATGPLVWLHAVSLGETRAAAPLVAALRARLPGMRLLLTHGTATGREAGQALLQPGDLQQWLPVDRPAPMRRFIAHHRPAIGLLMETETWPELLHAAGAFAVPLLLVNARLSARSLARGARYDALMRPALAHLDAALAQTDEDAARLLQAGVPQAQRTGNLKYDMTPSPELLARGAAWKAARKAAQPGRGIVLFASSREGEEAPMLEAWRQLPEPRPLLLLVPRHPQRFDEVAGLLRDGGWAFSRRSQWPSDQPDEAALTAGVWLGDSMGELPASYAAADAALLGGSFAPLGGQNLIEAAACACPVVMGPHTFNFAEAAEQALAAGAAERVDDLQAAVQVAARWATDPAGQAGRRERALRFVAGHRGATAATVEAVVALLRARGSRAGGDAVPDPAPQGARKP